MAVAKTMKNLIIALVGDNSLHHKWITERDCNFDLILVYYGDNNKFPNETWHRRNRKGAKFPVVADMLNEDQSLLDYQYIWLIDDDISIELQQILTFFELISEYKLWISQPSIMGWYGLAITLNQIDSHIRYTNYVEGMCPCFSSEALRICQPTFKENKSGWGIDALWNVVLGHPVDKIAIIDDVIAIHTRPIGGGDMYENHSQGFIQNAIQESRELYHKYNLEIENYEDLKNGRAISQELFGTLAYNIVEYSRVYKSIEAGVPVEERLWPQSNEISKLCENIRKNTKNQGIIAVL